MKALWHLICSVCSLVEGRLSGNISCSSLLLKRNLQTLWHVWTYWRPDTNPSFLAAVWGSGGGRPQREPDRAQPPGRPAALPHERRGPTGHRQPSAHPGQPALLQDGRGHCTGARHPLPCHVHRHWWAVVICPSFTTVKVSKTPDHFQLRTFLLVRFDQSEYGTVLKVLSTTNKSLHGCYLEELRILPEGQIRPIKSLQILHGDRSLFVGLDDRLVKIPLERCSSYPAERYDPADPQSCSVEYDVSFQSDFAAFT